MAFCSNCGNELTASVGLCPKCGQQLSASAPGTTQPAAQPGAPSTTQPAAQPGASGTTQPVAQPGAASSGQLTSNVAGMLCYVLTLITGILFLVLEPYNRDPFVRFHAFQAIFFCVGAMVVSISGGPDSLGGMDSVSVRLAGNRGPVGSADGPGVSKQEVEASRDRRPSRKAGLSR